MNAAWLALLIPVLALASSAVSGRWFILPLLVPRRWRWRFRRGRPRASQRSSRITRKLRARVLRADRHRCVYCGRQDQLQADHIVPWIMGGLTVLWNCATLCRSCNATKNCYWVSRAGTEYYHGRRKPPARARLILAAELDARRGVLRWLRAYGLLPSW